MSYLPPRIPSSQVTPHALYLRRREFLTAAAVSTAAAGGLGSAPALAGPSPEGGVLIPNVKPSPYTVEEERTPLKDVTTYNNFYEFSTDKEEPARLAHTLRARPWTVTIDSEVARPLTLDVDDLMKRVTLEERTYRFRCVEAWSMVIPWVGFELRQLLKLVEPTSRARHVAFTTLHDPAQMPGQKRSVLQWPYVEGLRLDEAMHPLTIMAVGLYGRVLPNQNGAPLRLVVPWKYGFKGIKSIVRIRLMEAQPPTTWSAMNPGEYGYFANVNPEVDHPRWSQAKERRIGEFFKRKTLPFNGYGAEVAKMYAGMDARTLF